MIDPETIRQAIIARLPVRVRWSLAGVPLDTDFSRCQAPLRTIEPRDIVGGDTQGSWKDLLLFGEQVYADGGGARPFLAVHCHTGEIVGLDVERESSQIYLLNSTVDAFIQTFEQLNGIFRSERADVSRLSDVLMEIDPQAFPKSDWRELIDELARTRAQHCT